jgi:superfamily I DNA and/or RNA helicase
MVEAFYFDEQADILLLSYTNRAVDEICKSIASITPEVRYIRIGNELSCDDEFRGHLFENEVSNCKRRSDVTRMIADCHVIVGTVAAISCKPELFRLKRFDVAIIDEATQILEPQLLSVLCARTPAGDNAVGKFIMIGDHKQLPAVVLQRSEHSAVLSERLNAIGLTNLKDSLFERLYRTRKSEMSYDMLRRQGRMHPAVAMFANNTFYGGKLDIVGREHQLEEANAVPRMTFIPSEPEKAGGNVKVNHYEANVVANIITDIYERRRELGIQDVSEAIGVITPYRSQIALIKRELSKHDIPEINNILVDTVERFQGSERDIIIYSFCVNAPYQLRFLSNLTEDNGVLIDRKLNVALTRARRQMYITGVPRLLRLNTIYSNLLEAIE